MSNLPPERTPEPDEPRRATARRLHRLMGGAVVAAAIVIIGVLALHGLSPSDSPIAGPSAGATASVPEPQALAVQVVTPQRRDIRRQLTVSANISPWYQATLYAKVPGYLKEVTADKGDTVRKGQLLATIDAPEVEQLYRQAEADFQMKRLTARRLHNVWTENPDVIAKQDVDVAAGAAEEARHLRDSRRTMVAYTKVTAPFDGTITARFADPGALIQSATGSATQAAPLYTIMDLSRVRIYANLPQEVSALAKPGLPVRLQVKEQPDREWHGTITRTTGVLDPATRTLLVEVDLPNDDRRLQPGMYLTATFDLETHQNVLAIPPAAILSGSASKEMAAFTVVNGQARRVPITVGLDDGLWVEVTQGLAGHEDVIVVGKGSLAEGQAVRPTPYNLPVGKPSRQKL